MKRLSRSVAFDEGETKNNWTNRIMQFKQLTDVLICAFHIQTVAVNMKLMAALIKQKRNTQKYRTKFATLFLNCYYNLQHIRSSSLYSYKLLSSTHIKQLDVATFFFHVGSVSGRSTFNNSTDIWIGSVINYAKAEHSTHTKKATIVHKIICYFKSQLVVHLSAHTHTHKFFGCCG